MITPVFWITQEPDFLLIRIRAPHGNLAELDYDHGENMFVFTCPPYFLRLHLKQMVQEYASGNGKIEWKSEEGEFHIRVPKLHRGENFTNLDMITELLNPNKLEIQNIHGNQLVEEIENSDEEEIEEDVNEFLAEQEISEEISESVLKIQKFGYGFGWSKMGVVERLRAEIGRVVDLLNPEDVEIQKRNDECAEMDYEKFDEGRYLADTLEPEEELLQVISSKFAIKLEITDADRTKLKDLKKKTSRVFGTDSEIAISLVDIIFAYCYDQRVNDWETNCESGWTISKISPSLSYLTKFGDLKECLIASTRRSLTYPLYRSFNLSQKIISDIMEIFKSGKPALLHILCEIHRIFVESGEFRYILNDLFITDYICWIQSVPEKILDEIREELENLKIGKSDLNWDLDVLETEAQFERANLDSDDDPDN